MSYKLEPAIWSRDTEINFALGKVQWCLVHFRSPLADSLIWQLSGVRCQLIATHKWETKGNPWVDFLMVIIARSIARGCVRTTTTTVELPKMAAILQIIGWQGHEHLVYSVLLWHWTFMLSSFDTCQIKVSADQYHVTMLRVQVYDSSRSTVFWRRPLTRCWFFDWIAGSCQVVTKNYCVTRNIRVYANSV